MTRPCPHCGAETTGPPDRPLDAETHPLGQWADDGGRLTARELRAGVVGHRTHVCGPLAAVTAKNDDQLSLDI